MPELYDVEEFRDEASSSMSHNDQFVRKLSQMSDKELYEIIDGYIDWEEISIMVGDAYDAAMDQIEDSL